MLHPQSSPFPRPPYPDVVQGKTPDPTLGAELIFKRFIRVILANGYLNPSCESPGSASHVCPAGEGHDEEKRAPSLDLHQMPLTFEATIIRHLFEQGHFTPRRVTALPGCLRLRADAQLLKLRAMTSRG